MYAVIRTGGKQVRVEPGERVRVEKLAGDPGAEIQLGDVLLVGDDDSVTVGTPVVDGASVRGTITAQARHPKIRVFKMKRRKGYRRMQGHRQDYTEVQVDSIDQ
ncbi:MAG: 50S ribosomal protein L21 [Myxococcota bacterium]|nr:50S ribosomal protein L21 [Spirochaeta sp.]RPG09361.1 MAG: 50S ribosomal protein L21 [Proteobacteria bacterium TMED72]